MEEAIGKFMDGMEAQERDGFKDLHRFVGRLPVPTVNASQAMSHKDALEGGFLPSMTEEEQKRFTPSELLLYKHALEYRYIHVHTCMYLSEPCYSGFRGPLRDGNTRVPDLEIDTKIPALRMKNSSMRARTLLPWKRL